MPDVASSGADKDGGMTRENGVFRLSVPLDAALLGGGLALSATAFFTADHDSDWDGVKYDSSDVNAFDRFFIHSYHWGLDVAGDVLVGLSVASPAALLFLAPEDWGVTAVMYIETLLIANGIKELLKNGVSRIRPYMYADDPPSDDVDDGDYKRSFPSGHSTMAFSSAAFFSYVFAAYFPDSKYRYAVFAGSFALAAATAGMRVASANHFPTDVIAGAVLGSAVGFLVPFVHTLNRNLHEGRGDDSFSLSVSPAGVAAHLCY